MSETKDETSPTPADEHSFGGAEVDLAALAADDGEPDPEEAGLDLSDLEAHGVQGMVSRLRTDGDDEPVVDKRQRRSPFVSLLVVGFGVYLLATMWADFRYWLHSSDPVELGHASTLLQDGRTLDAYDNQFVVIEGTPDVQHAARLTTKERFVGYLRVTEGVGSLFAAVPREKDEPVTNNFAGRYEGRLRRLKDDRAYEWLAEFYANEAVTLGVDLDPKGTLAALGSGSLPTVEGGTVPVTADETLRLVFDAPEARVQLGKSSFPSAATAEKMIAALGLPYLVLEPTATFHRFVVRIPVEQRGEVQRTLNAGLTGAEGSTDPKVGAFVLALPLSYGAPAGAIAVEGDAVTFPYGDNTTSPGYAVQDGRLVERPKAERLSVPSAQLRSIRFERVIEVDPDGFVVAVGETPSDELQAAILWLVVLAITGANLGSLVLWWRRRAA